MNDELQFEKSKRGKDIIIYKEYIYNIDISNATRIKCRCQNRNCGGLIYTGLEKTLVLCEKEHVHARETKEIEAMTIKKKISNVVLNPNNTFSDVITEALDGISIEEIENLSLPKYKSLRDKCNKKQMKKLLAWKKICRYLIFMIYTLDKKEFLLYYDDFGTENRIIIWSTKYNLEIVSDCKTWIVDGTFKGCPSYFYQLYTIHGFVFNTGILLVYCLMTIKTVIAYEKLFNFVRSTISYEP